MATEWDGPCQQERLKITTMSAMDVDPQPAGEQASTAPSVSFSLDLLQVIKQAQALNGLKHDDYGRYR
jgi:hypothetical protein